MTHSQGRTICFWLCSRNCGQICNMLRLFSKHINLDAMAGVATQYHRWNMDYQRMYEEIRRETYLYCCILRRFENMKEEEVEIQKRWKEYLALYLQAYRRCDNEYICRDEMMIPFTLTLCIAARHLSEACQK